jgi:hypothetical protein
MPEARKATETSAVRSSVFRYWHSLVPLGLTFIAGLVARTAQGFPEFASGAVVPRYVIETLSTAVRRGFDDPSKLAFSRSGEGPAQPRSIPSGVCREIPRWPPVSSTEDYTALVARMRFVIE